MIDKVLLNFLFSHRRRPMMWKSLIASPPTEITEHDLRRTTKPVPRCRNGNRCGRRLWRSDKLTHLCSFRLPHPIGVCFFFQVAPLVGQSFKHGALFAKFSPVVSMAQTGVNSGGTNGLDQENPEFMRMNFSFGG